MSVWRNENDIESLNYLILIFFDKFVFNRTVGFSMKLIVSIHYLLLKKMLKKIDFLILKTQIKFQMTNITQFDQFIKAVYYL